MSHVGLWGASPELLPTQAGEQPPQHASWCMKLGPRALGPRAPPGAPIFSLTDPPANSSRKSQYVPAAGGAPGTLWVAPGLSRTRGRWGAPTRQHPNTATGDRSSSSLLHVLGPDGCHLRWQEGQDIPCSEAQDGACSPHPLGCPLPSCSSLDLRGHVCTLESASDGTFSLPPAAVF